MNFGNYIFSLLLFAIISPALYAQDTVGDIPPPDLGQNPIQTQPRGKNIISCSAYGAITYNGHTIDEVNATDWNFQQLWGTANTIENPAPWSKYFTFGLNKISYNTADNRTQGLSIHDQQWSIIVLGKEIRIGDSFSELQQKFGQNLKIIYKPQIDPNYSVSFGCAGRDGDGMLIDLNPVTHKVVKIVYFVNP